MVVYNYYPFLNELQSGHTRAYACLRYFKTTHFDLSAKFGSRMVIFGIGEVFEETRLGRHRYVMLRMDCAWVTHGLPVILYVSQ